MINGLIDGLRLSRSLGFISLVGLLHLIIGSWDYLRILALINTPICMC